MSVVEPRDNNEPASGRDPVGAVTELIKHAIENLGRSARLSMILLASAVPLALALWLWVHLSPAR
jgi:hypothetical protein